MKKQSSYISFEQLDNKPALTDKFIAQAIGLGLGEIIKKAKGQIYLKFHKAIGFDNAYIVMVIGSNDKILIDLAEKGFPRGFPIFWIPDDHMQYYGFYPKFENDERSQSQDDLSEFEKVTKIHFFKKFSGFLGQVVVFKIDGNIYWTATSKNSAANNSEFIEDAKRLFEPFMTNELLQKMSNSGIHICAEVMSKNDQVHGTRVFKESPIITAVGQGSTFYFGKKGKDIVRQKFVDFYDNAALVDFCTRFNLPCDSAVIINNKNAAKEFLTELSKNRDFMNDQELEKLLKKHTGAVEVKKGTVSHSEVLGDCLEGLVLKLTYANGTTGIKKYKFPGYTIRTMLFREAFNQFAFTPMLKDKTHYFVNHWCISDEGKNYWFKFGLAGFMMYPKFVLEPHDTKVGIHIQLVENITASNLHDNLEAEFDQLAQDLIAGTIIVIIGPIGCGKTSMMEQICKINKKFVPIDGDDLGIGTKKTMKLGKERNEFSRAVIIDSLMRGKVPVFSTGGGVLFSGAIPVIKSHIYQVLGISVKMIVVVPGNVSGLVQLDNQYDPEPIYADTNSVKQVIIQRVKEGKWEVDAKFKTKKMSEDEAIKAFASSIATKSKDNCSFAQKLIQIADAVFVFPIITVKNYGVQMAFDYIDLVNSIVFPKSELSGKFQQVRLLTFVNTENAAGHITVDYDHEKNINMTYRQFDELLDFYGDDPINGNVVVMQQVNGGGNSKDISFVVPDKSYHSDGSTHITIDPGFHNPKEMKKAALMFKKKETVVLESKDGKKITYKLKNMTPCKIDILGAFGL